MTNARTRWRPLRLAATLAVLLRFSAPGPSDGSTVIPLSVEDLARSGFASILGQVEDLTWAGTKEGRIFTLVRVRVDEVLNGHLPAAEIVLKEEGGRIGGVRHRVHGGPSFRPGERVLLFLDVRSDGSLRTSHGMLGKFRIELDRRGMPRVGRRWAPGTLVLSTSSPGPDGEVPLQDVVRRVRRTALRGEPPVVPLTVPAEMHDPSLVRVQAFTLDGPARFFEPDEGTALGFVIDARGDSGLGLQASFDAVEDALTRWSGVPSASVTLQADATTGDLSTRCPGPSKIRFDDPDNAMSDPVNCRGILALAATRSTDVETKTFAGLEFERAHCGFLTFANGWAACTDVWTPCNLAEIATHELGHVIGLGHSSQRASEEDPLLREATMYFRAHFDGRCADVRKDDIDGVSFLYPLSRPPTITNERDLPRGEPGVFYEQQLAADGGAGGFTWTLVEGGFPGLLLNAEGVLSGVPTVNGNTFLRVRAADEEGNSHTKLFLITVGTPGPVPPTATAQATPTASPTPLPPTPCPGDCDDSGGVTVDELVRIVRIILGELPLQVCPAAEIGGDGEVAVDDLLSAVAAAVNGCPRSPDSRQAVDTRPDPAT